MAGEVLVDALPYIDQGYVEQDVREAALSLVEEECRRYRPTKNYLEHLPQLNIHPHETELMKTEFERIQNRLPMDQLSMKRYELPPPPPGKLSEITAWSESVDNSMAQLEHQATRALNLELMLDYCCETWKDYLEIFTSLEVKAENELQGLKKSIQEINWQRKTKQKEAGDKLRFLEAQWVMLVSKNYEIEQACADLETKIYEMKTELKISVVDNVVEPENEVTNGNVMVDDEKEDSEAEPMENGDHDEKETIETEQPVEDEKPDEENKTGEEEGKSADETEAEEIVRPMEKDDDPESEHKDDTIREEPEISVEEKMETE